MKRGRSLLLVVCLLLLTIVGCGGVLDETVTTIDAWTFTSEGGAPEAEPPRKRRLRLSGLLQDLREHAPQRPAEP